MRLSWAILVGPVESRGSAERKGFKRLRVRGKRDVMTKAEIGMVHFEGGGRLQPRNTCGH